MTSHSISPIGHVYSPFKQKFAIPRQSGLVSAARGYIEFTQGFDDPKMLSGLDGFSHLWLIFHFHQHAKQSWQPQIRPPRLGGNQKVGVLASRSTFRPNGLGLSVVQNLGCEQQQGRWRVNIAGLDLLDQTPLFDIKPYLPYADAIGDATASYAQQAPAVFQCQFSKAAQAQLADLEHYPQLAQLIEQVLSQDPRPAYHNDPTREYGMQLYDFNIRWRVAKQCNIVLSITPVGA